MPDPAAPRIAVIGAGIAGIAAARRLADAGAGVTLYDKGRGLGGRLATRRGAGGSFDHGAQLLSGDDPGFRAFLARAGDAVAPWPAGGGPVGVPAMNAPLKRLAEGLDIRLGTRVAALWRTDRWTLTDESDAALGRYDMVLSTVPAPQARALAGGAPGAAAALDAVAMAPQWALMLGWDDPPEAGFELLAPGGAVALIARMAAKPGRPGPQERWVAQAAPGWTRAHLEEDPARLPELFLPEIEAALGRPLPRPDHAAAHRWRYARTETPLGAPFLDAAGGTLLMGGDWALGPDAGHGWQSGDAMARAALARLFR